jgi:hypothetical protein
MAKGGVLVMTLRVAGVRQTLKAFDELPKDANQELRDRSLTIAAVVVERSAAAALAHSRQTALVAPTVRAQRDRVPTVIAGGSRRVGRRRRPASELLYAGEFGQNQRSGWYSARRYSESAGRQWQPHLGRHSYWFFRTAEANQDYIEREWYAGVDEVLGRWAAGG